MSVLSQLAYGGLSTTGATALARALHPGGPILAYHNVVRPPDASGGAPSVHLPVDDFASQLDWLRRHYSVVPLAELVHRLRTGRPVQRLAALTFDDGYQGFFDAAWPLLRQADIPATMFVVADAPGSLDEYWWDTPAGRALEPEHREWWLTDLRGDGEAISRSFPSRFAHPTPPEALRPASWETIRAAAADGLDVGVHSATHRTLPTLSDQDLTREVVAARDQVAHHLGVTPLWFAYPYGRWDVRVRDRVAAAGYAAAFTLDHRLADGTSDPWALPRVNVPAGAPLAAMAAWTAGLRLRRDDH